MGVQNVAFDREPQVWCVLCGHGGRGPAAEFHMTHGVTVLLCAAHRHPRFLRRKGGRVFVERLHAAWHAAGSATQKRLRALAAHCKRVRPDPPERPRPGSYAWPRLRELAEQRFAAGEDPEAVIEDLRAVYLHYVARVPSARTMRRWAEEARWLHRDAPSSPLLMPFRRPRWLRRPRLTRWPNVPYDVSLAVNPLGWFIFCWVDDRAPAAHWRRR